MIAPHTIVTCSQCGGPAKQYILPEGRLTTCAACSDPAELRKIVAKDPDGPLTNYVRQLLDECQPLATTQEP